MVLKEKYQEMYGEGQNFSDNVNKNVYNHRNMINDYTNNDFDNTNSNNGNLNNGNPNNGNFNNRNFNNRNPNNGNFNSNLNINKQLPEQTSYLFNLFIVFILASIIGSIIYFKDTIINYYNEITKQKPTVNNELKQLNKSIKEEKKKREKKQKETERESKIDKGGINQLTNKINYKSNQIAKEDGFCYIGYDKGMRNCGEIYESQICMSGEIFPSLEMCMFPKLRE